MADNLPISFPIPSESVIGSYSGIDIATGKGYAIYYLADDINETEFLTPEVVTSSLGYAKNYPGAINLNFDVTIGHPFIIEKGDVFVGVACADYANAGGSTPTLTLALSVDSVTIASGAHTVALPSNEFKYALFKLAVERKAVKATDVIRLNVQMSAAASANDEARIYFDPSNLTTTATILTTTSYLKLPIKLEI